ncbi:segregation/condensation protein A [Candidatus Woesearchaeota archaeon]|nr:segregation/condensation protein A [Candidatus Woesearchaeota archaeon]
MLAANSTNHIFNILFDSDEITWQSIIFDLVRTEQMDPWNVDISLISKKFLDKVKKFKEMDLRISGKVILASAILLRIKSNKLIEEDINELDALIASTEEVNEQEFYDELLQYESNGALLIDDKPKLYPRTPQPRKRKVSVFDLVNALEKALEVQNRRQRYVTEAPEVRIPEKSRDISLVIKDVHNRITTFFKTKKRLTFQLLLPSQSKEDKVYTFIPLLHLDHQRLVDLLQKKHLGEIEIKLLKKATLS